MDFKMKAKMFLIVILIFSFCFTSEIDPDKDLKLKANLDSFSRNDFIYYFIPSCFGLGIFLIFTDMLQFSFNGPPNDLVALVSAMTVPISFTATLISAQKNKIENCEEYYLTEKEKEIYKTAYIEELISRRIEGVSMAIFLVSLFILICFSNM